MQENPRVYENKNTPDEADFSIANNFANNFANSANDANKNSDGSRHSQKSSFSPKVLFGVFLILGFGTLLFGFLNIYKTIYSPFISNEQSQSTDQQLQQDSIEKLLQMQQTDTDEDGLSDYDEEYIYNTSPYLPDTDSDGYSDKQEIDSGNDPLCPSGMDCRGIKDMDKPGYSSDNSDDNADELPPEFSGETGEFGLPQEMLDELKNLTPDQVRALLLESEALTQEQLAEIDDESLMQVFWEVLGQ